jgi:hypothetical protein
MINGMQILLFISFILMLFIPVRLYFITKKIQHFSILKTWVSDLSKYPETRKPFLVVMTQYGLGSIIYISYLITFENSFILTIPLLVVAMGTIFSGIFRLDKHKILHLLSAILAFSGIILLALLSDQIAIILEIPQLPFKILNLSLLITTTFVLPFALLREVQEVYKLKISNLVLKKVLDNSAIIEWVMFGLTLVWNLLLVSQLFSIL